MTSLESALRSAASRRQHGTGTCDVTGDLSAALDDASRHISLARLRHEESDRHSWLALVVSFRSEILSPVSRFQEQEPGNYLPCDIPVLVPAVAAAVVHRKVGLAMDCLFNDNRTRLMLVFEGDQRNGRSSLSDLSANVWSFFQKWTEWEEVLRRLLRHDPVLSNVDIDVFLAGESFPSPSPLSHTERAKVYRRLVISSRALLTSVLTGNQMQDSTVASLVCWLEDLEPVDHVSSAESVKEVVQSVL